LLAASERTSFPISYDELIECVDATLAHLRAKGWRAEIVVVPYEFQRGDSRMLRIGE